VTDTISCYKILASNQCSRNAASQNAHNSCHNSASILWKVLWQNFCPLDWNVSDSQNNMPTLLQIFPCVTQLMLHADLANIWLLKGKAFAIVQHTRSDSRPEALCNIGSGSWLAWANDNAVHYTAIHCLQTTGIHFLSRWG